MAVLLISDLYAGIDPAELTTGAAYEIPEAWVPTPQRVAQAETIVVFGVDNADRAIQLAGALRHALGKGRTVILAYRGRFSDTDLRLYQHLIEPVTPNEMPAGQPLTKPHPAFHDYVIAYGGYGATRFFQMPKDAEPLAYLDDGEVVHPSALAVPVDRGWVYVVPWHAADFAASHGDLARALLGAVAAHRSGAPQVLPDFLADERLHGEQGVLDRLTELSTELAERTAEAQELERLRHMIGTLQGDALEGVVIDALNIVLDGTNYRAEDREDVSREDFWIVGPDGDYALAEVKAMGGGVSVGAVSQVSVHRSEGGHELEDLPGLLIANQYRGDDDFERRCHAPPPNVLSQLRYQNVLLLRTTDLYELVSRNRAGDNVGRLLIDALHAGGGWLEATPEVVTVHPVTDSSSA
jgi:hypothetical protein